MGRFGKFFFGPVLFLAQKHLLDLKAEIPFLILLAQIFIFGPIYFLIHFSGIGQAIFDYYGSNYFSVIVV